MTRSAAIVTLSSVGGAKILRGLGLGGKVSRFRDCWKFQGCRPAAGWTMIGHSRYWPEQCLDEVDVEWLLEGGLAYRDGDRSNGVHLVLTQTGRERLAQVDRSLFQIVPIDIMTTDTKRTEALRRLIAAVRSNFPDAFSLDLAFIVAQHILIQTFGTDWMERHIGPRARLPDFFRSREPAADDRALGIVRAVHLAEMIFNLQDHEGVGKSIGLVANGDVEAGFTELEVAKLLRVSARPFWFVTPRGVKGDDYDLEIAFGDARACAEAKCKIEDTEQSIQTVVRTLETARDQLPKDRPGIIIVSIPASWGGSVDDGTKGQFLEEVVTTFFRRGTQRIVSVAAYTSLVAEDGFVIAPSTYTVEFINPRHRFTQDVAWRMFANMDNVPSDWFSLTAACA